MHTHMRNPDPHTHATTHPLASMCSPTLHQHTRFPGSEHKRKQNIRFEGNKTIASVCVCKNALEREREGYTHTHTGQRNMAKSFFSFFLLLQSVTIKSCHIPMTSFFFFFFWWRKHIIFSYSHQTNNTTSNFLKCVFFYCMHILFTQNKIDVAIKKKSSFTHTHTHTHTHTLIQSYPFGLSCPM